MRLIVSDQAVYNSYWSCYIFLCPQNAYHSTSNQFLSKQVSHSRHCFHPRNNMRREGFSGSLKWFLLIFFLNSCVCQDPNCNDCCHNYKEINEPRRSINSIWEPGQTPLCDRLIPFGWYRFTSFNGTKMPETPVTDFHCGTHDPVWLKDPHPTVAEGNMARTACISSFGDDCSLSVTINVTKCAGDYFVYYLRPLYYCATAYCAGKET